MAAVALTIALLTPTYLTPCLEHPTCEVADAETRVENQRFSTATTTTTTMPPTTTTTEAPPPPPPPEPASFEAGVEQWRSLVAAYFPADEVDTALRVMECESGGDPTAYNDSTATGLMQVHWLSWGEVYGVTVEDLMDPETNIAIAADIWSKLGWAGQWSCY